MVDIQLIGSGSELQGVGRLADGRAVFVPGGLPGETVRAEITKEDKRFCEAKLTEVLTASPDRRKSDCPYFGQCGGCQARHMSYEKTLELKRARVYDALTRIGGANAPEVRETIGSAQVERTRNKAEYPVKGGAIGAFTAGSHAVVDLEDCLLQKEASVHALNWFRQNLSQIRGGSHIRHIVTRVNRAGDMMLTVCADTAVGGDIAAIAPKLRKALPELKSLYFLLLNRRPAHAMDGRCTHLWGEKRLTETLLGLEFTISPQSFFQVNPEQTEVLYTEALKAAGLTDPDRARELNVLDAYCGAGTISLSAAKTAKRVTGVEIVPPAIADAKENAQRNGLNNARFLCADAGREIPKLIAAGERFDVVILDPPRKGADEALLDALIKARPETLVYVSCNPATLARDIGRLAGEYKIQYAQPVDMFPWTGHVETVCLLSRK